MDRNAQERFEQVRLLAGRDPEYRDLERRCAGLDMSFLEALEKLEQEDRCVIMNYIRTLGALTLRLTEIACEL